MVKLRENILECFRTEADGDVFFKLRSYISTSRKNGIGIMDAIKMEILGNPFILELG